MFEKRKYEFETNWNLIGIYSRDLHLRNKVKEITCIYRIKKKRSNITEVGNEIMIENYLDFTYQELKRILEIEVSVVVEEEEFSYDHGSSDFDVDVVLNSNL